MQELGVDPNALILIDDSATNVEAARKAGLQAVHYSSADQLRSALAEAGVYSASKLRT